MEVMVAFTRSMLTCTLSVDSMVPTSSSVLDTEAGFLDTLPVRPGTSTQQLMLTYEFDYAQEVEVAHPLFYPVSSVSLFVPDAGLSIESDLTGTPLVDGSQTRIAAAEVTAERLQREVESLRGEDR